MQPTLLILAAGMASRYGSLKQIQQFGPSGETIIDYSIYDAIKAGFGKIVFIIRRNFEADFKEIFEPKLKGRIAVDYVFQEMDAFVGDHAVPEDRTKPWGTAHAILCAKNAIKEPFAVINADDFYGTDSFVKMAGFLNNDCKPDVYSVVGYELGKTISEHGSVSRGVCAVDAQQNLTAINERTKVYQDNDQIVYEEADGSKHPLSAETPVSMNFWGFHPSVFDLSQELFNEFLEKNLSNPKAEFFIPIIADQFISRGVGKVKVLPTSAKWFGVTYKEDAPGVQASLSALVDKGEYPDNLWK
ncbi:sugar phosphate nucleotidyltransferase [Chitinophaga nivalis]|uniref:Sugar phosphate nucleotidyltransferase n=1 Tax=Chitinophaga nivalis TaxID=2991709 RepID=A0ABT3IFU1_9BACT|nr:sugar phosphate nucleotidyltransferase [Chitinophaga nivalis]MCW3467485.1 sugar phosphate nucleotidyltransferase [Chitinophaga nivalis]MCW3482823.1 sugar phosphate nucleotidyltransferase [Chitinophaga nivalis]